MSPTKSNITKKNTNNITVEPTACHSMPQHYLALGFFQLFLSIDLITIG